jgi:8-oxo-dGTP pyrophosphatase MutT (NUDIX family)
MNRRRQRRGQRHAELPDILYHATTRGRLSRYTRSGQLDAGPNRQVFLSHDEDEAWRVAHRFRAKARKGTHSDEPVVLYVDAGRAWRSGVRFHRTRNGLWLARSVPARHVLNLRPGFREQVSAGGFLIRRDRGQTELALVACVRRSGTTWEIAKGKLETGETPEQAAMRELQEEMGFTAQLRIGQPLGMVRYGFRTPEGHPRLKSLHVYLIESDEPPENFDPAEKEGIKDVRWFSVADACQRVTHTSLLPVMKELAQRLG